MRKYACISLLLIAKPCFIICKFRISSAYRVFMPLCTSLRSVRRRLLLPFAARCGVVCGNFLKNRLKLSQAAGEPPGIIDGPVRAPLRRRLRCGRYKACLYSQHISTADCVGKCEFAAVNQYVGASRRQSCSIRESPAARTNHHHYFLGVLRLATSSSYSCSQ